ncbi:MAG: helix-turn-helix domain-containing protein [Haloarculaceae archaeon]
MRYFQIRLTPEDGGFYRADVLTSELSGVERVAIVDLNLRTDGTGVALVRLQGDREALATLYDDTDSVLSYDLFDSEDAGFYAYVHFEPDEPAAELLAIVDRHRLVIEPPMEFTSDGSLRLTAAGPQELVRRAAKDLPEGVQAHLELIGEYDPDRAGLLELLTDRQREVLRTAVDRGYYEIPRRATHEDLAAALGCSAGTVGEHLRKIEACVLAELVE